MFRPLLGHHQGKYSLATLGITAGFAFELFVC